jgi:hypothetical protein
MGDCEGETEAVFHKMIRASVTNLYSSDGLNSLYSSCKAKEVI